MGIKINRLTDKMKFDLADGKILTSYGDFELKKYQPNLIPGKPTLPGVPGGIFDSRIFGSPYLDRCECGFTVGRGNTCSKCHSHINTDEEMLSAVGLIKSPVYFINSVSLQALNKLLSETFSNWTMGKFDLAFLYTKFFIYDEKTDSLSAWSYDDIENPDFTDLSIEGLIKIFEKHKKSQLEKLMYIVQRYILVRPISMRPWSYTYKSWLGTRTLEKHQLNFQYQSLIYISTELMNGINLADSSVEDLVYSLATIRLAITKIVDGITNLIESSKGSSIRQGFSTRIPNSGRGVALADPDLGIDEVSLPIGMCYEIFRNQFMDWIHVGFKLDEDEITYKMINKDKDMVDLFKKFVNEKELYAMINRAPTLYKLSQLVFKVKINEGSAIGYSLMATTPLNLDFDGDTIAVYEVPEHLIDEVQGMLPSKLSKYMKSDEEVIKPKQETLIGLMIATRIEGSEDKSDKIQLRDLKSADDKYENGEFNSYDIIRIGTEKTTYGRAKLSAILGVNIDYQITDKNISKLVTGIKGTQGFNEKMKGMQDFGLEVATYESQTDLSLENLKESAVKIDKSEYNIGKQGNVGVYAKSLELIKNVNPLKDSLKGSKAAISSIVSPQMTYNGDSFVLTSDSMLNTLSAAEYVRISAEFRKVQQIKVNSVGESGYLSRQIWTAMSKLVYSDSISNKSKLLTIIPDMDGTRYAKGSPIKVTKGVPVDVDSVVFSKDNTVHENDLYNSMKFKDGHLIGIDFGMQISEGTTQGILKLKHEGGYISYSNYGLLTADTDCNVAHDSDFIYINGNKFLKSVNFKFVDPNKTDYKKGDLIGINPTLVSPGTNLYLLMKLVKALGSTSVVSKPKTYLNLYAINKGTAKFVDGKLDIGGQIYVMPEESLCLIYEGQEVEIGDKLFTGPLNYQGFVNKYSYLGVNTIFKIFERELKSFANIKSILIEFLFKAIHYIDVLDNGDEAIVFKGISNAIDPSEDLLTSLTLGFIKKKVSQFIASDSNDIGDSTILNIAYQFNGLRLGNLASNKIIENE